VHEARARRVHPITGRLEKRTLVEHAGMSALCQKRTLARAGGSIHADCGREVISNRSRNNARLQLRSRVLGNSYNELGARRIAEDLQVPL